MLKLIVKQFRKVMGKLREKPDVRLDDHEFEHILLYHGLVGTSPDNQRSFKDVRADITDAVENHSSLQMAIALKVQPLHWQDKLEKIFGEIAEKSREELLAVLLPDREGEPWPDSSDPLGHDDWRVRANAAFALGFLEAEQSIERMVKCLNDTASGASPAYCHIAYALAKLPGIEVENALINHIDDPEPWFRIDTAVALSNIPGQRVKKALMQALLTINPLSDYLAVSLSKKFPAITLLNESEESSRKAGCQMITGLIEAANQTFTPEILQDTDLEECATKFISGSAGLDVFALRSMLGLVNVWQTKAEKLDVSDEAGMQQAVERLDEIIHGPDAVSTVQKVISSYAQQSTPSLQIELLDAIQLAGALKLKDAVPDLLILLKMDSASREEIISALGTIGDASAAQPLVTLAHELYKTEQRIGPSISAVPVIEEDNLKSKLYWRILQALGNLPGAVTTQFLMDSANDFAPDKRQQILESLNNLYKTFSKDQLEQYAEHVKSGLDDPSATVRVSSLKGIAVLHAVQHIEKVLKMSDSQEPSVSRQALATLSQLAEAKSETVVKAIQDKLSAETDEKRKKRLAEVLKK